jgi:hypothetical protein
LTPFSSSYILRPHPSSSAFLSSHCPLLDNMRLHAALYASALLAGTTLAQEAAEQEPLAADTSSPAERPTFTVCLVPILWACLTVCSLRISRRPSSNSSPTTGKLDGPLRTQRRRTRKRIGPTSVNGLSRSLKYFPASQATRDSSSRTPPLTTPSQPSSPPRLTTRARHSLCSTRSNSKRASSAAVHT